MQEDAKSYLKKKAQLLDLGRGEALGAIQKHLDGFYPKKVRAVSLNEGVLKLHTPSSALANELRLNQVDLLKKIAEISGFKYRVSRLLIHIST